MAINDKTQQLLIKYFEGRCSGSEKQELALWIHTLGNQEDWEIRLQQIWEQYNAHEKPGAECLSEVLKEIIGDDSQDKTATVTLQPPPAHGGLMKWAMIAAAVIGAVILISLIYFIPNPNKQKLAQQKVEKQAAPIRPGSNKAILTLANGKKIILDSAQNGTLKQAGPTQIIKVNSGLIAYQKSKSKNIQSKIAYNTITTPRGGQYKVILSDGSKIWLNAVSSVKFPTPFTGKTREIIVKGEVYAEIAKNKERPFIVHVLSASGDNKGNIKVLGTRFDVNAYLNNAPARTTLIDGAVKVSFGHKEKVLAPGEQALTGKRGISIKKDINTQSIIAWKNGLFDFTGSNIREVMQRISRWYDVKVKYDNIPSPHFMGTISRNAKVSEVLKMLEMTGAVHFRVEGKTITVL